MKTPKTKLFFLTKEEYNAVKGTVSFKNFNRVPGINKEVNGFAFYAK